MHLLYLQGVGLCAGCRGTTESINIPKANLTTCQSGLWKWGKLFRIEGNLDVNLGQNFKVLNFGAGMIRLGGRGHQEVTDLDRTAILSRMDPIAANQGKVFINIE